MSGTTDHHPLKQFVEACERAAIGAAAGGGLTVLQLHKEDSMFTREAVFSIRVRLPLAANDSTQLSNEAQPDAVIDPRDDNNLP